MANTFLISDLHLGHKNILTFQNDYGKKCRPFETIEDMHEAIMCRWNETVRPQDTVYVLGDVAIPRAGLKILDNLMGRKVLIMGNHDIFGAKTYLQYFDDVRAYKVMTDLRLICSHIPIDEDSLRRWRGNVHGHLHHRNHRDPRYLNVSCEQVNYTPMSIEDVRKYYDALGGSDDVR